MKRPLIATLIIGIFVVIAVVALHLSPQVLQFEQRAADYISSYAAATHVVPKQWQYVFMSILSFGVAALTVTSLRRGRIGLLVYLATGPELDDPPEGNHFPTRAGLSALLGEAGLQLLERVGHARRA